MSDRKTGTREWAEQTLNVATGCRHNCVYCYAAEMAHRFHRLRRDHWANEETHDYLIPGRVDALHKGGRVMFPSSHDWTPGTNHACVKAMKLMLWHGLDVLVVSKACSSVVREIMAAKLAWGALEQCAWPELRMSITCLDDDVRRLWEPGAAPIAERVEALRLAKSNGLPTSVSCEPLLEPDMAEELVERVAPLCVADEHGRGGEIWIGLCNQLRHRTAWLFRPELNPQANDPVWRELMNGQIDRLEAQQSDEYVMGVYRALKGHPQVRWKDSYAAVIARNSSTL